MKKLFSFLLFLPFAATAQKVIPKYEHDTLYTTSGYKMYKGMALHLGKGSRADGKFRYINIKSDATSEMLANDSIIIRKMKNFGISALGNAYIEIIGSFKYKDGSKGYVDLHIAFEKAIESNLTNYPGEIVVPDEFIGKLKEGKAAGN